MKISSTLWPAILVIAATCLTSCGTVRPEGDYGRAQLLIRERTGAHEVYDPTAEFLLQKKVTEMLDGGLTLDEAVTVTLLNNRDFQSRFQEIGVSAADLAQSALWSNPSLSFSARFPDIGGRSNLSFGFAQEIVELWQIPVRKRIAKDQLEQTIRRVASSAIDLAAKTKQAYVELCALEANVSAAKDNLDLLEHMEQLAKGRFNAGEASILDVNLVRSNVLDGKLHREIVQRDLQIARAAFDRLLGLSQAQTGAILTDPLPTAGEAVLEDALLIQSALSKRIDIQIAALDLDAAEAEIRKQHRSTLPSLSIGLDGERPEAIAPRSLKPLPPFPIPTAKSASTKLTDAFVQKQIDYGQTAQDLLQQAFENARGRKLDKSQTVDLMIGPSVSVTLPIWDQNRAQNAKARYLFTQKQKDYEEMMLAVAQEVRQAAALLRAAANSLELVVTEALPLAEKNVGTAQRTYEAGEENILTLLVAQQTLNAQRETKTAFQAAYASALAELERATGGMPERPAPSPAAN